MARESFKATPGGRNHMQQLPPSADSLPDTVLVDLDSKDPNTFEVVVTDDAPEADRGRPTEVGKSIADQEDDLRGVSTKVQKRIDRLRFETHTERRGKEAAERERDAAIELARAKDNELAQLRRVNESGTTALANSMKAERESKLTDAQRRLEQAHSDGDSSAIAKATRDMTEAQAELTAIIARTPPQRPPGQPAPQQQQPAPQQPNANLEPKTRDWLKRNDTWWGKDKAKTAKAMSLHYELEAENILPTSPEYTREIDKRLKAVYPEHEPFEFSSDMEESGNGRPQPRRTNVVTEGSRDGSSGRPEPSNSRTVELTASEVSLAQRMRIPLPKSAA